MIIPALDLIDDKLVRLYQGDYNKKKFYDNDFKKILEKYKESGVKYIHLVDLLRAKVPSKYNINILRNIISHTNISFQIGGGIRNKKDINELLSIGAKKIVISSLSITDPNKTKKYLKYFGGKKIILALDIIINLKKQKEIYINGWRKNTHKILEDVINYYIPYGLNNVLCTDINKDGTLNGPNIILYKELSKIFSNINFQASGGVSSLKDIDNIKNTGVKSIIIGKALLEKKININEAISCWQKE
ncbi:1-(5-phosphoribosyl)-5-[(5-phosphoribosylamino)methylideneamino]imidazole-4-carboxamide isomerase [Buchnera aphidicola (Taiwanaphis decaspermi)]|uniref:1-(5-phosphoribosyl)-5-[(5- phosphoribosylamino)methylideneamino]imidazole-4- carboxamide isomerase n=1 Tax=Buchnera aphidicola TaxID=9 RepID=UPI0031B7FF8F